MFAKVFSGNSLIAVLFKEKALKCFYLYSKLCSNDGKYVSNLLECFDRKKYYLNHKYTALINLVLDIHHKCGQLSAKLAINKLKYG